MNHRTTITEAFLQIDVDRSGFVDPKEFERIFRGAGIELAPEEMAELVKKYARDELPTPTPSDSKAPALQHLVPFLCEI